MPEDFVSTARSPAPDPVLTSTMVEPFLQVLHVNDSTDDQVLFQAACRHGRVPFNWHVADSADKGISYLRALLEQSKRHPVCWPDLILLDVVMPVTSGFEVLRFIRSTPQLKHLPVVIFTGHDSINAKEESSRLGATMFLLKPGSFLEIVELAKYLYTLMRQMNQRPGA